jgi:NTE family protein
MHMVEANDLMNQLDVTSKLNTSTSFIHAMQAEGRSAAELWLERHFHQLGVTSSFDLGRYLQ